MGLYKHTQTNEVREIDADLVDAWIVAGNPKADGWTAYTPPPPPPAVQQVPQSVTMRQARAALINADLIDGVEAAINAIPDAKARALARNEWERSTTVERSRGLVSQMGPALGLTSAQIDALFIAAAQIP